MMPEITTTIGIKTCRWFVQKEDTGRVDGLYRKVEPLAFSTGIPRRQTADEAVKTEFINVSRNVGVAVKAAKATKRMEESKVFHAGQLRVERRSLCDVSDYRAEVPC